MSDAAPFPVVDSHHHFWDPEKREYPFLTDPGITRPFGPDDLRPLLAENGVNSTVLVQTVADLDETREFLRFAGENDFIAGVVGWVDLTDPALPHTLAELREGPNGEYLVGIRHPMQDEDDDHWILQPDVVRGLEILADAGLVYDLLVKPQHLAPVLTVTQDLPNLKFVIDHMAKPDIASGEVEPWVNAMREFAALEHVACKFSGILTEAGEQWTVDDLRPFVRPVVEIFGARRMMFGSDWPVSLLAADYGTVLQTMRETLDDLDLTQDDIASIFGITAMHWYGLSR